METKGDEHFKEKDKVDNVKHCKLVARDEGEKGDWISVQGSTTTLVSSVSVMCWGKKTNCQELLKLETNYVLLRRNLWRREDARMVEELVNLRKAWVPFSMNFYSPKNEGNLTLFVDKFVISISGSMEIEPVYHPHRYPLLVE